MARLRTSLVLFALALGASLGCQARLGGESAIDEGASEGPLETPSSPGTIVVRRLNRLEYNRTVADLLGTSSTPADSFPADDLGGEFDTVGAALSLSPLYVIALEQAAHALTTELFATESVARASVLSCDVEFAEGDQCARNIVEAFARRAFRRPLVASELEELLHPVRVAAQVGATRTEGLRNALAAVLLSPHFLFKIELDPETEAGPHRLAPFELATRLSYALWSTMPDDELFTSAELGLLTDDVELGLQIDRMLDDPRSEALLEGFFSRWLDYQHLEAHQVEATAFPSYSVELAEAMKVEADLFFADFLASPSPVQEMLRAPFTFVDDRLAEHYGITRVTAGDLPFTRVETSGTTRGGLLTLGAVLTTTSFSSRTSPVKRGDYVFSRILCGHIPPPPPGVEGLAVDTTGLSLRERLEIHREKPECMGCHSVMDPLGFGLENYDAIGAYRTVDGASAVNSTGELPDGATFDGAIELGAVLADDPRVPRCVTEKFLSFAVGRRFRDEPEWADFLAERLSTTGGSFRDLIRNALLSEAFRSRDASVEL